MDLRACVGVVEKKIFPELASNRTPFIQPVSSHFTELAASLDSLELVK
jgi:hypothetical protein